MSSGRAQRQLHEQRHSRAKPDEQKVRRDGKFFTRSSGGHGESALVGDRRRHNADTPLRQQRNFCMVVGVKPTSVHELRHEIDAVDTQILELLHRRLELVFQVGDIKRENGVRVYDPERERQMLARLADAARPPMNGETVRRIFERIIDEFRAQEKHHIQEV